MPFSSKCGAIRERFGLWNTPTTVTSSGVQNCPSPYPSFEDWRRDADLYVDLDD